MGWGAAPPGGQEGGLSVPEPSAGRASAGPSPGSEHSKLATEDPDTLGEGAWQVQFNACLGRAVRKWDGAGARKIRDPWEERCFDVVLGWGVSDRLDLAVGSGYGRSRDDESGLDPGRGMRDLALSAKWRFFEDEAAGVAVGLVPGLVIPTGTEESGEQMGTGGESWHFEPRLALVKDWSDQFSTNLDVRAARALSNAGDTPWGVGGNLALGWHPVRWFQPEFEVNWRRDLVRGGGDSQVLALTAGSVLVLSDTVSVRAGLQRGLAGRDADLSTIGLVSVDFNY